MGKVIELLYMPKGIPKNGVNKGWLKKGNIPWSKGLHIWKDKPHPKGMLGKKRTIEANKKTSLTMKGHKKSIETRKKFSENNKGSKCHFWKGGVYEFRDHIRDIFEYRQWRSDVFTRDDFTCQNCFVRGGEIHAHHIKHFSKIIEDNNITTLDQARSCPEFWNINNGITLCHSCHKQEHKSIVSCNYVKLNNCTNTKRHTQKTIRRVY